MNNLKEFLKKSPQLRNFVKYIRRTVFHSKYIYFLSSSPRPLSFLHGFDRGIPLDRYFIEEFLHTHKEDIRGSCLEIRDNAYTIRFGEDKVLRSDVLDVDPSNKHASIIDDIRHLQHINDNTYNTIILTQVLQFIDDVDSAIAECYRVLIPGGILLVTLPSLSRADCTSGVSGDFWRFTQASAHYLFEKKFESSLLEVDYYGNARSSLYVYAGLAIEDTPRKVLLTKDANFPTIITVRATK